VTATNLRVSDVTLRLLTVAGLRGIADAHRELAQLDQALTLEQCFHQLDELAREYPEERLAVCAERGHAQYSLGHVHWHARRYPQAREAWDTGFELLRQAHADSTGPRRQELASAISHEELDLVNVYGRVGAWQEAARHRARYIAFDRFTTAAWEARFSILTLVADAGESYEDACRFMLQRHADDDPTHTAWMLLFGPQTVLDPAGMIELARRGLDTHHPIRFATPSSRGVSGAPAKARNRRCRDSACRCGTSSSGPSYCSGWGKSPPRGSPWKWAKCCTRPPRGTGWPVRTSSFRAAGVAVRGYWWEECYDQLWRSRAWEAINGHPPDDPWAALFEARGPCAVGDTAESERAFEAAVNSGTRRATYLDHAGGDPRRTRPIRPS
jgi:hypothetical protein